MIAKCSEKMNCWAKLTTQPHRHGDMNYWGEGDV